MGHISLTKSGLANQLLLDVADRIQLAPTEYRVAEGHYEALTNYINGENNPFKGLVRRIYPQGSIAIGAVIASKFDTDEFDVDAVIELNINPETRPDDVLTALFNAVNGKPGSRYHGKVDRCTRCITVNFGSMHVDLTPAVLMGSKPRESRIFHAKEKTPQHKHYFVTVNPFAFAEWFKRQTPTVQLVMDSLHAKTAPLPAKAELFHKSLPLIALQLIKRWRNVTYEKRDGRKPPSAVLTYFVGKAAGNRGSLLEELTAQVNNLVREFSTCDAAGQKITVRNPECDADHFSDRWPETLQQQAQFTADLKDFANELQKLAGMPSLEDCSTKMSHLFGERPTRLAIESFSSRYREAANANKLQQHVGSGAIALGASALGAKTASAQSAFVAPRSTNFGSD